ncbi:MAG: hypothetical protein KF816_05530 [Melioribacteraceae bacterium]|nr:hypothetical protein [Melioribacteraceae bacterium]
MRFLYNFILFSILIFWGCREKITDVPDEQSVPPPPISVAIYDAFDGQIGIEWHKVERSGISYKIYRSKVSNSDYKNIALVNQNYFVDTNLEYDVTYYYKISSVNLQKLESELSDYVYATPKNIYPPLRPQFVKVNGKNIDGDLYLEVKWNASVDSDISHYEIFRDTLLTEIIPGRTPNYISKALLLRDTTNVSLLRNYYYRIISVDKGGLKSSATLPVSDLVLNTPQLISPANSIELKSLGKFIFRSSSLPSSYKLFLQLSEHSTIYKEFDIGLKPPDQDITLDLTGVLIEPNRNYLWRVAAYYNNTSEYNSISQLRRFYLSP